MKLKNMLAAAGSLLCGNRIWGVWGVPADAAVKPVPVAKSRTPEEAKARRKAYRKRKAAKAARRRNRR